MFGLDFLGNGDEGRGGGAGNTQKLWTKGRKLQ